MVLSIVLLLCINVSFFDRAMVQVRAQSLSGLTTIITLISSFISNFYSGGSTELFREEERVGQRDCSNEINDYYRIDNGVLPDGTVYPDTNYLGRGEKRCGEWIILPPANYDFYITVVSEPRTGPERIECKGPSLSTCSPGTFTCKDNGYSCN